MAVDGESLGKAGDVELAIEDCSGSYITISGRVKGKWAVDDIRERRERAMVEMMAGLLPESVMEFMGSRSS